MIDDAMDPLLYDTRWYKVQGGPLTYSGQPECAFYSMVINPNYYLLCGRQPMASLLYNRRTNGCSTFLQNLIEGSEGPLIYGRQPYGSSTLRWGVMCPLLYGS